MTTELLMIEQRQGSGDAAFWVREGERLIEGQDSNRRLVELRAGLVRHSRVRPVAADARRRAGRAHAGRAARGRVPAGAGRGLQRRAGGDAGLRPARPGARHPGQQGARRRRAGGDPHLDHRRRAAARRRPLHLRGLPAAGPPRRPRLPRRLLLPEQRRGGGAAALRRRPEADRDHRPRPPLPERDLGPGRADGPGRRPALAARGAGDQPAAGDAAAAAGGRTRRLLRREPRRRRPTCARSRTRSTTSPRSPGRWSSRSATTRWPATRTAAGASSRRSSPRSAACWPSRGCRSA